MSFLGAVLRATLEDPLVPISSATLGDWLNGGPSTAGVQVSEKKVLGLPAFYRGVAITAGTLAGLPLKVYRNGTRQKVAQRTVLDSPNPRQTPFEFWFTIFANGLTWGNGFARKRRDGADIVRQVWPIHPARVRVEEIDASSANPAGKLFLVINNKTGQEERLTPWDVFHLPYMSVDGVVGVRPLEVFRQSLGIAIAGDGAAAALFANGMALGGTLQTEQRLEPEDADRLKERWKQKHSGPDKAGDIAVLDKGLKFEAITMPPGDAQLLESRHWAVGEIGRMVGIPPHLIGDVEKSTSWGTGIEEQVLGWVKFTLQAWITGNEQRVTRELLPGGWDAGSWYAKHSLEALLRGDSAARSAFYHAMITDGWGTRNEARDFEDRETVDGLDDFIVPSNMTLISIDGTVVPLSAAGSAQGK